jgi:hypothetical protein
MPLPNSKSTSDRVRRVAITIPASGASADTLENLVVAALNTLQQRLGDVERPRMMGGRVNAVGTAYAAGDSVSSQPLTISASSIYEEPAIDFLKRTWVKSSGVAISAVVSVYLSGEQTPV